MSTARDQGHELRTVVSSQRIGNAKPREHRRNRFNDVSTLGEARSLTDVERRYSQTEKEALALVWACDQFPTRSAAQKYKW